MALLEKTITTQEELNAVIGERLKRERESVEKRFEGWKSPEDLKEWTSPDGMKELAESHAKEIKALQDAAAETQKEMAKKDAAIAEGAKYKTDLEKTRIALAAGLDQKYASRLMGENEEEWKKDAEELAKDFGAAHFVPPMGNPDPVPGSGDTSKAEFLALAKSLKNKE